MSKVGINLYTILCDNFSCTDMVIYVSRSPLRVSFILHNHQNKISIQTRQIIPSKCISTLTSRVSCNSEREDFFWDNGVMTAPASNVQDKVLQSWSLNNNRFCGKMLHLHNAILFMTTYKSQWLLKHLIWTFLIKRRITVRSHVLPALWNVIRLLYVYAYYPLSEYMTKLSVIYLEQLRFI